MQRYKSLIKQKFNRLCPCFEGPRQSVIMSFNDGEDRFIVHREITRRVGRNGQTMKPTRKVVVRKI